MAQYFVINAENPQARLIKHAVEILRDGGIIAYPTDSSYALGCMIGNKNAQDKIRQIRGVDDEHLFTLICRNLSELSVYAHTYVYNMTVGLPLHNVCAINDTPSVHQTCVLLCRKSISFNTATNRCEY